MTTDFGYIYLAPEMFPDWLWYRGEKFSVGTAFIDLLIRSCDAPHKVHHRGKMMTVELGQVFTTPKELAKAWRWSVGKVRRFLNDLEALEYIQVDGGYYGTLITIVNCDMWQVIGRE